jgi:hypothetical protein
MELDLNRRIDRFANRELHPAAARALAHEALSDADLFEQLTAVAVVQAALESPATTDRALAQSALDDEDLFDTLVARGALEAALRSPDKIRFRGRRSWPVIGGLAAIASCGLPPRRPNERPNQPARPSRNPRRPPFCSPALCSRRIRVSSLSFGAPRRRAERRNPTAPSYP